MINIISKIISVSFIIIFINTGYSQDNNSNCFYKHFTGNLDGNMNITVDMFSENGKVNGFYYYSFAEPGNETILHYGKTIPLEGTINGNSIILNEFSNEKSNFIGKFSSDNNISGNWKKNEKDEPIPFDITEDYSNGSLAFNCYTLSNQRYITKEYEADKNTPKAKINISFLYPRLQTGTSLKDSIDYILTSFLINEPKSISSPELLLENITFDFFDSYFSATDGIEDISATSSFNWEKDITMNVYYNDNNIVSLRINKYVFTGGAHGMLKVEYIVFNSSKNKRLALTDIFKDNFEDELNAILDNKLRKLNGLSDEENLRDAGFFIDEIACSENFYINNDGIGFFYNVYEIAPYSSGTTELFVSSSELAGLLKTGHPFSWVKNN